MMSIDIKNIEVKVKLCHLLYMATYRMFFVMTSPSESRMYVSSNFRSTDIGGGRCPGFGGPANMKVLKNKFSLGGPQCLPINMCTAYSRSGDVIEIVLRPGSIATNSRTIVDI